MPADRSLIETAAKDWVQAPLIQHGDVRYTTACMPHLCGFDRVDIAYAKDGGIWIGVMTTGKVRLIGSPPAEVGEILARP